MNLNLYSLNPKYIYLDAFIQKEELSVELKGKPGIYLWYNKLTGGFYVGSAKDLTNRLLRYYRPSELARSKGSLIHRSLLKNGHSNFCLIILETCLIENLTEREQYYFDLLKPVYNILKFASSSLGFAHSEETKLLISKIKKEDPFLIINISNLTEKAKGRKMTTEFKKRRSELTTGKANPNYGKGNKIIAFDTELNTSKVYSSVTNCAKDHNTTRSSIQYCIKHQNLYKGRYSFKYG